MLHHALDNLGIDADKLLARHARLARQTGSNDDNIGVCRSSIVVRNPLDRRVKVECVRALHHVHRFAFGNPLFDVNEDDFLCKFLECDDICHGCAYVTCTNNSYLHKYFLLKNSPVTHP